MSGDTQRSDDLDPIDDDFVIEDLGSKADDLEPLFAPQPPVAKAGTRVPPGDAAAPAAGATDADAEDMLFEDHTVGLQPTERFEGKGAFGEASPSQWTGEGLELDEVGVPPVDETAEAAAATAMAAAEATFSNELGSLLASEEEFALDTEADLEVVGGAAASDGISEFEQSGPFVLDDGDGTWQNDTAEAAAGESAEEAVAEEATVELESMPALSPVGDEPIEPGWEPLPAANVDDMGEVDDVARTDEEAEAEAGAEAVEQPGQLVGVGAAGSTYGYDDGALPEVAAAPVLIGANRPRARSYRLALSMAAALLLCSAAVTVFYKPAWFGVGLTPDRVEVVQIERPQIRVDVPLPRLPEGVLVAAPAPVTTPTPTGSEPVATATTPVAVGQPQPTEPPAVASTSPVPTSPTEATPVDPAATAPAIPTEVPAPVAPSAPVVVTPAPSATDPSAAPVAIPTPEPTEPSVPTATSTSTPATAPSTASDPGAWPLAGPVAETPRSSARAGQLVRVSDQVMVGEVDTTPRAPVVVGAVDGVLPGSRAFAQLRNGNFFIGSVKCSTASFVTLRIDEGEVTLAVADLARLTQLGSADYDELQKATSGFVRLTNNNRLVGGILSKIADDHIVLEFRSNRVMLPKNAVGEVVHGEGDAAVRLDVTREEDEWLRQLSERQLGSGVPPGSKPPAAQVPVPPEGAANQPPTGAAPTAPGQTGRPR